MVKYRIPLISEFVQDFEFQYKRQFGGGGIYVWDQISNGLVKIETTPKYSKWINAKVWWLPRTKEEAIITRTYSTGEIITSIINPIMDCPFHIPTMIENKIIRVKI